MCFLCDPECKKCTYKWMPAKTRSFTGKRSEYRVIKLCAECIDENNININAKEEVVEDFIEKLKQTLNSYPGPGHKWNIDTKAWVPV